MKKVITIILLCLAFIVIYFLQLNFFSWFTIAGVKPNIFIILILFIGLYSGTKMGLIFGIAFGLAIDTLGNILIRRVSYSFRDYRISTEDILKKAYLKIVKLQ